MSDDDPLTKFTGKMGTKSPTASAKPPSSPERRAEDGREPYEAFDNKVRPVCLEIRSWRSGLSHSIPYAHIGVITFNFRTGAELFFTGCGVAVTVKGRNLSEIARAIRLHTCAVIQDQSPEHLPQAADSDAAFVESITVEVLCGPATAKVAESA